MPESSSNPYRAAMDMAPWPSDQTCWRRLVPRFRLRDILLAMTLIAGGVTCLMQAKPISEAWLAFSIPGGALLGAGVFALYRRPLLGAVIGCGLPIYLFLALWGAIIVFAIAVSLRAL